MSAKLLRRAKMRELMMECLESSSIVVVGGFIIIAFQGSCLRASSGAG